MLFGDIGERPGLSKRDRSWITVAALVALNRTEQLSFPPHACVGEWRDERRTRRVDHNATTLRNALFDDIFQLTADGSKSTSSTAQNRYYCRSAMWTIPSLSNYELTFGRAKSELTGIGRHHRVAAWYAI